jgi:hypothetical protein
MPAAWDALRRGSERLREQGDANDPTIAEEIVELEGLAGIFRSGHVRESDAASPVHSRVAGRMSHAGTRIGPAASFPARRRSVQARS